MSYRLIASLLLLLVLGALYLTAAEQQSPSTATNQPAPASGQSADDAAMRNLKIN